MASSSPFYADGGDADAAGGDGVGDDAADGDGGDDGDACEQAGSSPNCRYSGPTPWTIPP